MCKKQVGLESVTEQKTRVRIYRENFFQVWPNMPYLCEHFHIHATTRKLPQQCTGHLQPQLSNQPIHRCTRNLLIWIKVGGGEGGGLLFHRWNYDTFPYALKFPLLFWNCVTISSSGKWFFQKHNDTKLNTKRIFTQMYLNCCM